MEAQSAQKSHLPLGAIVCPLARPERGEVCMEKQTNRKHVFRGVQNEKDILKKMSLLFVLFGLGWFESV